jgi:integral membrane sensor domain MASE1
MATPITTAKQDFGHPRDVERLSPSTRVLALSLLVLGIGYFVAGKAGLFLHGANSSVSVVWPASGIAIAALLLGGYRLWPAVFAGAFFVNLTTTWDPVSSAGLATGNTLEALVGVYLANRFASGRYLLNDTSTVLTFALLSGFLAASVAATIGTLTLIAAHLATPGSFLSVWAPYWLGDAIGVIEVAPLILALSQRIAQPVPPARTPSRWEAAIVGGLTVGLALLVFARDPSALLGGYPLIFLVIPPTIWAAFRFGSLGAVCSVATVSVIAIVATISGLGPFATLPPSISLLALRIFMASIALTVLLVAADVMQHRRLEGELYYARKELQRILIERTVQLDAAESLAKVGTWTYDVGSTKMMWSDETYRMLGYGEERFPVQLEKSLERVRPDDRARFRLALADPGDSKDPPHDVLSELKLHLDFPNGEERVVLCKLRVTAVESGAARRLAGTVQDVTERERIEAELNRLRKAESPETHERQVLPMWMLPWVDRHRR